MGFGLHELMFAKTQGFPQLCDLTLLTVPFLHCLLTGAQLIRCHGELHLLRLLVLVMSKLMTHTLHLELRMLMCSGF
jgi:hypothetical protein